MVSDTAATFGNEAAEAVAALDQHEWISNMNVRTRLLVARRPGSSQNPRCPPAAIFCQIMTFAFWLVVYAGSSSHVLSVVCSHFLSVCVARAFLSPLFLGHDGEPSPPSVELLIAPAQEQHFLETSSILAPLAKRRLTELFHSVASDFCHATMMPRAPVHQSPSGGTRLHDATRRARHGLRRRRRGLLEQSHKPPSDTTSLPSVLSTGTWEHVSSILSRSPRTRRSKVHQPHFAAAPVPAHWSRQPAPFQRDRYHVLLRLLQRPHLPITAARPAPIHQDSARHIPFSWKCTATAAPVHWETRSLPQQRSDKVSHQLPLQQGLTSDTTSPAHRPFGNRTISVPTAGTLWGNSVGLAGVDPTQANAQPVSLLRENKRPNPRQLRRSSGSPTCICTRCSARAHQPCHDLSSCHQQCRSSKNCRLTEAAAHIVEDVARAAQEWRLLRHGPEGRQRLPTRPAQAVTITVEPGPARSCKVSVAHSTLLQRTPWQCCSQLPCFSQHDMATLLCKDTLDWNGAEHYFEMSITFKSWRSRRITAFVVEAILLRPPLLGSATFTIPSLHFHILTAKKRWLQSSHFLSSFTSWPILTAT